MDTPGSPHQSNKKATNISDKNPNEKHAEVQNTFDDNWGKDNSQTVNLAAKYQALCALYAPPSPCHSGSVSQVLMLSLASKRCPRGMFKNAFLDMYLS